MSEPAIEKVFTKINGKVHHVYVLRKYYQKDIFGGTSLMYTVKLTKNSNLLYTVPYKLTFKKRPRKRIIKEGA